MLNLMEELLLLALDDEKGKIIFSSSSALPYGLRGALLLELALMKKIDVVNKKLVVINDNPTENSLLNNALEMIANHHKQKKVKYWVSKLKSKMKQLRKDLLSGLMDKGIIEKKDEKILWLIPTKRYPTKNPIPENEVRSRIIDIVLHNKQADERSLMLISLINSCSLIKEVFAKEDRKIAKKKIKEIVKGENIGNAIIDQVNDEIMVAIIAATTAATVAATSSSS